MTIETKELHKRRYEKAKTARANLDGEIREVFRYIAPERQWERHEASNPDRTQLYDTTAMTSLNMLVTTVLGNFVPMGTQWVKMIQSPKVLAQTGGESADTQIMLQKETNAFFNAINKSNFYLAMADALKELAMVGTAAVAVEYMQDEQELNFMVVPYHELHVLDDGYGCLDTKFRTTELPVATVVSMYPKPKESMPSDLLDLATKQPDYKVKIIEVVAENGKNKAKPHSYHAYLMHTEGWVLLRENFTRETRMIAARWDMVTGSPWGDCPGRKSLPDMKSINAMVKSYLKGSELRATPPMVTQDETFRDRTLKAGTTYYAENEIKPIEFGDPQVAMNDIQMMREQIKRTYMDFSLPPVQQSHDMTAREVIMRQTEFFRSLGHTAVTLEEELLRPLVAAIVDCLQQAGEMTDMPFGSNEDTDLEFNSVVRAGQNQDSISRDLTALAQLANFGEAVAQKVDIPGFIESVLLRAGFSAQFIKTDQQMQQEAQQGQATAAAQGLANAIGQGKNPLLNELTANYMGLASPNAPQKTSTNMRSIA